MTNRIQIRRGTAAARDALNGVTGIKVGELLFATDDKTVFIGDGSTNGGFDFVGAAFTTGAVPVANIDGAENEMMTFDASGDAAVISAGADNTVLASVAGVPTFQFVAFDNVASADFITNLASVPGANKFVDAATIRAFVISQVNGLSWRPPVDYCDDANTSPINTTKPTDTAVQVDSSTIVDGDRVLFTNLQDSGESADDEQVFIASVAGSAITWTLETDGQAGDGTPTDGDTLFCEKGTVNADRTFNYNGTAWVLVSSLNGSLLASNNLSDVANAATSLTNIGGIGAATTDTLTNKTIVSDASGGTNPITVDYTDLSNETAGDILFWTTGGAATTLAIGSNTQVLTVTGGLPVWATPTTGTITNSTGSSVDNEIVRFDGASGNVIQDASSARMEDDVTIQTVTYGDMSGVSVDGGVLV